MLDYQRIVDEVRSSLFSNNAEGADFLRMAAADYSVACDDINERLRRCGTLLKKGLRSEAIQLAEVEPNLLDLVATLDFPERQHWIDVLSANGIVAPCLLMLDVAADLNEAYAIEQPLTELLRQHRLLALSRGPLSLRVSTLRSLSQSDGNNPVWHEDLAVFEHERQRELQKEVAVAAKESDLAAISALDDELRTEGWLELPPRELVRFTADIRRKLEDQRSRAEMAEAVRSLNDSFAAFDVEIGRQWRERFHALAAHCGVVPGDEPFEQATPALAWLAEQDEIAEQQSQHDAAVAELEEALRHNALPKELIRKHNAARANGFALSDGLVAEVKDRLAAMERTKKLKQRTLIGGISIGVLLITCLIVLGVRSYLHGLEVARQADALGNLLDAGDLKGARSLIDQTPASVAASDEIQRLGDRLEGAERKEAKRHETFEADLRQAQSASTDSPDYDALKEASSFAKTTAEKAELKQYKDGIAATERAAIAAHDVEFNVALVGFHERLKKLEAGPNDDIPTALAQVVQFRSDFKAMQSRIPSTTGAVSGQAGPMLTRLDAIEAALRRRQSEESQLELITRAVGDPDAYQEALAGYVRQFPDVPRSADFKMVLEDAPIWLGLTKWNELLLRFRKQNLGVVNPGTATTLLAAGNSILKDYDNYPSADAIRRCLPYLEAISRRVDTQNEPIIEALKRYFNDPLMSDVWMIELTIKNKQETFYLKHAPELDPENSVKVAYIAGFDMIEKSIPGGVRAGAPSHNDAAPQTILAKTVRMQLDQINDENWDRTFFRIVQTILADDPPVDPILKFNLLKQTLDVGCHGSRVLEEAFKPHLSAMQDANVDPAANWLDPFNQIAQKNRAKAAALFGPAFPDVKAAGKAAANDLAQLGKPAGVILRWVGWLRRGGNGDWRCNPDRLGSESGDLVMPIKKIGGATLVPIGKLERGIPELVGKGDPSFAEGRPVYLVLP